jgi:hypothetical protein
MHNRGLGKWKVTWRANTDKCIFPHNILASEIAHQQITGLTQIAEQILRRFQTV